MNDISKVYLVHIITDKPPHELLLTIKIIYKRTTNACMQFFLITIMERYFNKDSIIADAIYGVLANGCRYYIDIHKGLLKVGKKTIVENWVAVDGKDISPKTDFDTFQNLLLELYERYTNAIPSKRENKKRFFYVKDIDGPLDIYRNYESRYDIQFLIESYLLGAIMNGTLNDVDSIFGKRYFWCHHQNKNLIIFKVCITNFLNSHKS